MAASLTRSNVSFRRQGSSGIVWSENSTPIRADGGQRLGTSPSIVEHRASPSPAVPKFSHSRSTGFMETRGSYFPGRRSHEKVRAHKHSFLKWIKRILSKSG